jgi:hypothetical protein
MLVTALDPLPELVVSNSVAKQRIRYIEEMALYAKVGIYGDYGAGKTFLACTAPDPLVLLTDTNAAEPTIMMFRRLTGINIPIWPVSTGGDLDAAQKYLASGKHPFKSVVIDSLTDVNQRIMREIVEEGVRRKPGRQADVLEMGDWNVVLQRMYKTLRDFRDLPMHVIVTALATDINMRLMPFIQPKGAAMFLPSYFNLVGFLGVKAMDGVATREWTIGLNDAYATKGPEGVFPMSIKNPNLTDIITTWQEWFKTLPEEAKDPHFCSQ